METPNPTADQAESSTDTAFTAEQLNAFRAALKTLGIAPDQATPESIGNALNALAEKAAKADELAAKLQEVSAQLGTLQADAQTRLAAELDAELAAYELDATSLATVKALAPEQRKSLLPLLLKKNPATAKDARAQENQQSATLPPKPVHDPQGGTTAATTTADRDKAVAEYQKAHPGLTFSAAWNAVRREQPELFADSTKAA